MLRFLFSNKAVVGLLAGIAALIMIVGCTSSLWFLRGMWGPALAETEFGYQRTAVSARFFAGSGKAIDQKIGALFSGKQDYYQSVSYNADDSGEYMALIPRLRYQLTAKARLSTSGWHVSRVGWILVASRARPDAGIAMREYGLWSAVIAQAKASVYGKLPLSPLFIFRTKQAGMSPIAIYASREAGGVTGVASIDAFEFMASDQHIKHSNVSGEDTMIVALPSNVLAAMHSDFSEALERLIAQFLHFQKTAPALLSSLPAGEDIYLTKNATDIAVGVRTQGEAFGRTSIDAMNAEQGQRHPKKKAFALPDNSVGYEYVRAAADVGFAPGGTTNGCLPSERYDETLFLCGKQEAAVLASSENMGSTLIDFMSNIGVGEWRGYVPGEYSLSFSGSDKEIHFWIDKK